MKNIGLPQSYSEAGTRYRVTTLGAQSHQGEEVGGGMEEGGGRRGEGGREEGGRGKEKQNLHQGVRKNMKI